ncbi:MAG: hypothetical protein COZ85_03725 [Candidatus Moranbacteria bacterium CG_4_8_14_3_um_filter_34_16]|nr:MAG: hypothetical protein COT31_02335 [Candidatus Moranbacteria bacterium CG08_land_8_20_14_0_20_34_16]PIW94707.1 MAG: hypothetical protein COZ85_03725 [Candidatus Moranbacteria bacterium CG_4_8_14_3_um_filter_34_16]
MLELFLTKNLKINLDSASASVPPARSEVSKRNTGGFLNLSFFVSEVCASFIGAPPLIISP